MKKSLLLVVMLGFMFSITLVSAYRVGSFDVRDASEGAIELVVDFAEPFLQVLLGGDDYSGLLLFERLIIFFIIFAFVYFAVKQFPAFGENKPVLWIISLAVPLLSVRFISFEWINTIIIQYQVLGIALTALIPFIVFLLFLHGVSDSSTVRKIGWIFFIVVYFGLWATAETDSYGQIYFWTMLIALIFLLLDGTIHRWYIKSTIGNKAAQDADKWKHIADLRKDIRETKIAVQHGDLSKRKGDKIIKEKKKSIDRWLKWKPY